MNKIKVKVMRRTRGSAEETFTDGYTTDDIPGLGVHRANNERKWTVTHLGSGYSVLGWFPVLNTRKDALAVAERLAQCGDWTKEMREIVNDMEFKKKVGYALQVDLAYLRG